MRRPGLLAMLIVLAAATLAAQQRPTPIRSLAQPPEPKISQTSGVIVGIVVDAVTGRGVPKAVVTLSGPGTSRRQRTDEKGRFYAVGLPAGDFSITAAMPGFYQGAYGRLRPNGEMLLLPLGSGQWIVDVKLQLWRTAAVSGIVVDERNEPIVDVRVQITKRSFAGGRIDLTPAGEALTDDAGLYRIYDLQPGDYLVSVPGLQISVPLATLENIGTTGSVTRELSMVLNQNGPLTADSLIVDPRGTHALVAAQTALPPTGDDGRAFAYSTSYYPAADVASLATPISIAAGEERGGIGFQLRPVPTGHVSGIVKTPDGPAGGRLLRLVPLFGDDLGLGTETALSLSAPDGTFTFLNVPHGSYTLESRPASAVAPSEPESAETPGMETAAGDRPRPLIWGDTAVLVHGDVDDVTLVLREGATIRGRIVFDGVTRRPPADQLATILVRLDPAAGLGSTVAPAKADSAGYFMIRDLVPGRYAVRVSASLAGWHLRSAVTDGRDATTSPVELSVGEDANVVVTFTDKPTRVTGVVWDSRGFLRAPTASVIAFPTDAKLMSEFGTSARRVRTVRAGITGQFALEGLPPGDYYLVAVDESNAEGWHEPRALESLRGSAIRVSLREGEQRDFDLKITVKK